MDTIPVISTENLTRRFGDTLALDRLTLQVYPGEVFGYLGHNGAGKTTTVRLLNGVLNASDGMAQVLNLSPVTQGSELRARTGVLTETPSLEERLTARENLAIYAELYGVPRAQVNQRLEKYLQLFELADRAGDKVGSYSKGMKQRLALARALLHDPEIIFLDEPTAGLDPVSTRSVHELINRLSRQEGRTIFMCTHNLAEAQKLCDRVAVLEHGRLVALGTPQELAEKVLHRHRLEIEVSPDSEELAIQIMQNQYSLTDIQKTNGILSAAGARREEIPALIESLVAAKIRLYRVSPQEPSLEDVYFALHQ
ncbi:MAG: ABC transporter ATP-binding protein [Anaerolineales bacterium]|jgi:ABC-2 type transport system ATP-binding protein